jgi:arginyl-tRNA synthetase
MCAIPVALGCQEVCSVLVGDIGLELGERVARSLHTALDVRITAEEALIRPATRPGADYQCNAAMSLAKRLGKPPREVAEAIVADLDVADLVEPPEVTGPGFVNFVLRPEWLARQVSGLAVDDRAGVPTVAEPRRFAIDYGSPNVTKEMHVGHLRSTIIGDAIVRLLRFAGHEVIPHNHLGDWGTPFGMLIEHLIDIEWDSAGDHTISDLNVLYQEARQKFDADPAFADRARLRVVALQGGDERTLALWRLLVEESARHFRQVYQTLGVLLSDDDWYGESFYNPMLADTIDDLDSKGLTRISDGAVCVFPDGFTNRAGEPLPLILRKSDGGYGYHVTDLATVRYWVGERHVTDLLYFVGTPQSQHFQMIFAVCRTAGYLTRDDQAVHVNNGSILGEDGKTIRTRAGGSVKLVELLAEAVEHAAAAVAERSELDDRTQAEVARAVGIGAVKYADLSSDRVKDYTFTWSKMLAKDGNTSVYLQYANARIQSILRRAGTLPDPSTTGIVLDQPAERALALATTRLPAAITATLGDYSPHKLCGYLYETAAAFTTFYEQCPILAEETPGPVRASRLVLAQATSRVLTLGLSLLGITTPERM